MLRPVDCVPEEQREFFERNRFSRYVANLVNDINYQKGKEAAREEILGEMKREQQLYKKPSS